MNQMSNQKKNKLQIWFTNIIVQRIVLHLSNKMFWHKQISISIFKILISIFAMKNKMSIFTILIIITCLIVIESQCPAQLDLNGVQVGLMKLTDLNNNDPSASPDVISFKEYSVALNNPLKDAKILLALAEVSALSSSMDLFDLNIISKTETQFVLGFIYEPAKWVAVSYRYLVSNRNDLSFQMITLNSGSFKPSNDRNSIIVEASLDKPLENFEKYEVLSFMRGLKYKNNNLLDHSLAVSINDQKLSQTSIIFNISAVTNSENIELQLLSLSYLYFEPKQAAFASFGGLITEVDYVGKSQIDILHADLPTNLYLLYGITNIDISSAKFQIGSKVTEDAFFNLETSVKVKRIDFTYFSIGRKASQVCESCVEKIISGNMCVKDCNSNEIYYQFKDGSRACQKCPQNLVSDSEHLQCVVSKIENLAVPQGSFQSVQTSSKSTQYQEGEVFTPINPNAANKTSLNPTTGQTSGQSYVPLTGNQFQALNNVQTSNGQVLYQTVTNQLSVQAPSSDQFEEFNYCSMLPNSYWTGESCQCKVGYKLSSSQCVRFDLIEQTIVDDLNSEVNSQIVHTGNTQNQPQTVDPKQNTSIETDPSQLPSCLTQKEIFNPHSEECECKQGLGYKVDQNTSEFVCVQCINFEGFYLDSGRCQHCGSNQIYDKENKVCLCKSDYEWDANRTGCVLIKNTSTTAPPATQRRRRDENPSINQTLQNPTTVNVASNSTQTPSSPSNVSNPQTVTVSPPQSTGNIDSVQKVSNKTTTTSEGSTGANATASNSSTSSTSSTSSPSNASNQPTNTSASSTSSTQTVSNTNPIPTPVPTTPTQPAPPTPTTTSPSLSPATNCMKLSKTPQINAANIYISLQLSSEKNFKSEDEMQNFLKQQFEKDSSKPSSVYCIQSDSSLKEFDCLLLYPAGVPNTTFDVKFWFTDAALVGGQCSLNVQVNPLESAMKSMRSLRRR